MKQIAIIGGGAWGTALASAMARKDEAPLLWLRDERVVREINQSHENPRYLPGVRLPENLVATSDETRLNDADIILLVTPAQSQQVILQSLRDHIKSTATLVLCAKGIEREHGRRASEVVQSLMPENPIALLSGPSFADDVARGLPTAITLATNDLKSATNLSQRLSNPALRLYASNDIVGVEFGGALKNVMALAVGMARGKGLGASAEAALTTRGFAELMRIAVHFGAKAETLTGLSGLGDLILTCSSPQSRNFSYGLAIGENRSLEGLKLAEGVFTTSIAAKLCKDAGLAAPIITAIHQILEGEININEAMETLLSRPLKIEIG